jgi:hypothetical protein
MLPAGSQAAQVALHDATGRLLCNTPVPLLGSGLLAQTLDTSALPPGVYFIKITSENGAATAAGKFIKH